MFQSLKLLPVYYSKESDIAEEFYIPVLREAVSFDRISAYFSAKAIAHCAEGLEYFSAKGNKCRLIISKHISEDDFNQIKLGYKIKKDLNDDISTQFKTDLTHSELKNISNLAYFISIGVVEIKIAFMKKGTFHYKFGVYTDKENNIISSCGSDNFTESALIHNAESLTITCSWLCSDFDYPKITSNQVKFDKLWNNNDNEAFVASPGEDVINTILSHNKGELILDEAFLESNSFVLDYRDDILVGINKLQDSKDFKLLRRMWLAKYINEDKDDYLKFNKSLTYSDFKKIINLFADKASNIKLLITSNLKKYLESKELYIKERADLGLRIKQNANIFDEKLASYKKVLLATMERELREKQLWDSFFMYIMKKSSNFSVPGSGKTSSVLGVFAYLQAINKVDRIVVISPINAFGSWKDEFEICFGEKKVLKCFSSKDNISTSKKREILNYDWHKYNLLLFNYESVEGYINELKKIISNRTLLVFDEVHKVKGLNGKRAEHALDISKDGEYVISMTGTPIPNSYKDIFNNLNILFPNEYGDFFNFSQKFLSNPSPADIEKINKKIKPFFCRTSKEELDVPDANKDETIKVDASHDEEALFNIIYSKYKNNKFSLIVRLLQLEANPRMLLDKINPEEFKYILEENDLIEDLDYTDFSDEIIPLIKKVDKSSKLKKCVSLAKQLYEDNKPVIIWTIFKNSIVTLKEALNDIGIDVDVICGETDVDERASILAKFKNGESKVLITNPHTLAESISLHHICHDAIYFEYSYNLVHLLQSKDRIHRLGLDINQYTQYYFLQTFFNFNSVEYSLDCEIYNRLKLKEEIMLEAIKNNALEELPSIDEDIENIFNKLKI